MSQFIETIKIKDGYVYQLPYHQARFDKTRQAFFHNASLPTIDLANYISSPSPTGLYRCRILYGPEIVSVEYLPYQIKPIKSLRVITTEMLDYPLPEKFNYHYKYANRTVLNQLFSLRGEADEILIVDNHVLKETSIANVALFKEGRWLTPEAPLLKGTKRAYLLEMGKLLPSPIHLEEIFSYQYIMIFNAMIDWQEIVIPINRETIVL